MPRSSPRSPSSDRGAGGVATVRATDGRPWVPDLGTRQDPDESRAFIHDAARLRAAWCGDPDADGGSDPVSSGRRDP